MKKLHVGKSRAYARIDEAVRSTSLPRHVASLLVARYAGVNFSRFATDADLAIMRGVNIPRSGDQNNAPSTSANAVPSAESSKKRRLKAGPKGKSAKHGNHVFVVHGRNEKIRKAL